MIEIQTRRHKQGDYWEALLAVHFGSKRYKTPELEGTMAYCFVSPDDERGIFLADEDLRPGENAEESVRRALSKVLKKLGFDAQ